METIISMTDTAFTLRIVARLVWVAVTDYGTRPFPKLIMRWERYLVESGMVLVLHDWELCRAAKAKR